MIIFIIRTIKYLTETPVSGMENLPSWWWSDNYKLTWENEQGKVMQSQSHGEIQYFRGWWEKESYFPLGDDTHKPFQVVSSEHVYIGTKINVLNSYIWVTVIVINEFMNEEVCTGELSKSRRSDMSSFHIKISAIQINK